MIDREKSFIIKISLIMATRMLGLFMIFPVFAIYGKNYQHSTPLLIGVAIGAYGFSQALLQIPYGYLSDKFGRKLLILIGISMFLAGSIIASLTDNIYMLILARIIQGSGAIASVIMAFIADFVIEKNRTKVNAIIGMQIGISFMIAIVIGPIVANIFGIQGIFIFVTVLSIIALIIAFSLPDIIASKRYKISIVSIKQILNKELLTFSFSIFILHFMITAIFTQVPIMLNDGGNNNWYSYLIIVMSFIFMIPLIIIAEKKRQKKVILLFAIMLIFISQIMFSFIIDANYLLVISAFFLFFIAFNTIEALLPSMIAKIAENNYKDKKGLAMGFFSTSQFLGAFSGGIISGIIHNFFAANNIFLLNIIVTIFWFFIILGGLIWQE